LKTRPASVVEMPTKAAQPANKEDMTPEAGKTVPTG